MSDALDPVLVEALPADEAEWAAVKNLAAMGVRSLAGLRQRCPGLEIISLTGCGAIDVADLAGLTELRGLQIYDSGLTSIEALAGNQRIAYLNISRNLVEDLRPLLEMPATVSIQVEGDPLSDESFHKVIPALQATGRIVTCSTRADWLLTLRLREAGLPFCCYRKQGKLRLVSPGLEFTSTPAVGHPIVDARQLERLLEENPDGIRELFG